MITREEIVESITVQAKLGKSRKQIADLLGIGEWRIRTALPYVTEDTKKLLNKNGKANQKKDRWKL